MANDEYVFEPKMKRQNYLAEIREEYGLTQQQLVTRGGFSAATINGIENPDLLNYPESRTRRKLVDTLNLLTHQQFTEQDIWPT